MSEKNGLILVAAEELDDEQIKKLIELAQKQAGGFKYFGRIGGVLIFAPRSQYHKIGSMSADNLCSNAHEAGMKIRVLYLPCDDGICLFT